MKRLLTLLLCLALPGGILAGCGSDNKKSSSSAPATTPTATTPATPTATTPAKTTAPAAGGTVEIKIKDIKFAPESQTVKVGDTVKWTNDDPVAHTVTATSGASFDSGTVDAGGTYTFKATKAGTVDYVCTIHPGQKGQLVVQ